MSKPDIEREYTKTLREILRWVGGDEKYAEYAQLHSYLEWMVKRIRDLGNE